jgi:TRAP-type uncharacterized transport system substrate-binding protein
MAVVIQKTTDLRCAAESTGASVENSRLVGAGESDMGMVMGSIAYKATQGLKPFEKKFPLVALFQMYPAPEHIVTVSGKGIESVKDLKGKKVSIDVPGSGCAVMAKAILEEYGFNLEKDLTIAHLSQSESVQALKDGIVDAVFFNFAYPAAAVLDLAVKITMPAKTYPKVGYDVLCLGDSNVIVANKQMEEEVAYRVVKTIFENVDKGKWALKDIHPIAAQLVPSNAINSPIELHPGAIKYFKEVGAIK